jgi:hypothetical protein
MSDLHFTFANDPVLTAMDDPTQMWGDLLVERVPHTPPLKLKMRKDIWQNFPVSVYPLGSASDCAERHAIVWRRKELAAWRDSHPSDYDEWMRHEYLIEHKLLESLKACSKWTLEEAEQPDQICIIRMKFKGQVAGRYAAPAHPRRVPHLTRLNDIKAYFPVVWRQVGADKIYSIELYDKQIKIVADVLNVAFDDLKDRVGAQLMSALRASTAWRILSPVLSTEYCRIELTA